MSRERRHLTLVTCVVASLAALAACTAEGSSTRPDVTATGTDAATVPAPPSPSSRTTEPASPVVDGAYYVSPEGSDDASGSADRPWGTLAYALGRLRAGDTLYVRGGRYRERIDGVRAVEATADSPITVQAFPGERPVLEGLLWLTRPSYWVFDGLNVTWSDENDSDEHMVKITDGVGWTWRNSEVWGARSVANFLVTGDRRGEPSNWTIEDNCIHHTYESTDINQDSNLYIGDMREGGPGLVQGNLLFEAPNGRNIKIGPGRDSPERGPDGVTVRYNTLYNAAVPLVIASGSNDILVERNIIAGSAEPFLVRGYELAGDGVVVRDNIGFAAPEFFAPDNGTMRTERNRLLDDPPEWPARGCGEFVLTGGAEDYGHLAARG